MENHLPWWKVSASITSNWDRAAVCLKGLRTAWSKGNTVVYPKRYERNPWVVTLKVRENNKLFCGPWQSTCFLGVHKMSRNIFMSFSEKQQNSRSIALKQIHPTKISGLAGLPVLLWGPIVWCFADCWAYKARKAMFSKEKEGLGCTDSMDTYYSVQTLENVIVIAGRDHRGLPWEARGDCQEPVSCLLVWGLHLQHKKQR